MGGSKREAEEEEVYVKQEEGVEGEEEEEVDPMAAMMGFGGFGTTKVSFLCHTFQPKLIYRTNRPDNMKELPPTSTRRGHGVNT